MRYEGCRATARGTSREPKRWISTEIALLTHLGYPIICVPIGVDLTGLPVSLSVEHTALKEGALIKWARAIEALIHDDFGGGPKPAL